MGDTKEVLRVEHLCKKFKSFEIKDINFNLEAGYILGLVGRNGAGKTTLMKLIQNIQTKNSGKVVINGFDNVKKEVQAKQSVGFIMDHPFFSGLSLEANGALFGRYYDLYDENRFLELLDRFKLSKDKRVGELSKGMETKFQLAFALSHQAKLLIMDEPTGGLDPLFRREFLTLIKEVVDSEKVAAIISTHITSDLDKVADYIAMIDRGEMLFHETKEELFDQYTLIKGSRDLLNKIPSSMFVSVRKYNHGFEALTTKAVQCEQLLAETDEALFERANIEDIMYYLSRERGEAV